jgi:deazaflavin-dependent oxidoreductase (nitroreductase family)
MRDDISQALAIDSSTSMRARTVDITTTGRRSGEPRRIETVFYRYDGTIYLSGLPAPRPRAWLLNLEAEPKFTFHLKHGVVADLPAVASVVTDPQERQRVLSTFVEEFNARRDPAGPWPEGVLEEWVDRSPLARVSFPETAE